MPNTIQLPIVAGNLPPGFCPATYQDILNMFASLMFAQLSSGGGAPVFSGFVVSATKPTDTTVAWLQLDSLGRPTRLYFFAQGAWLSLHPTVPGLTMWWFQALPDFTIFDGGDANSASPISGAMWQQALDANSNVIAAQFPIAAGTLPSTTVLSVPGSGGEEQHVLVAGEVAPHTHILDGVGINMECPGSQQYLASGHFVGDRNRPSAVPGADVPTKTNVGGGTGGIASGHNNMPPYVVGYLLQRTNRLYYVA